ncbi:hypothetical protein JOD07_001099 [Defluviitalea raffinosedens]|nr:hypothetical protein [Defluviitalea raffinosedens]
MPKAISLNLWATSKTLILSSLKLLQKKIDAILAYCNLLMPTGNRY